MGLSRPRHPKNGHFLPKNGLKMPILGQKHYFYWGWVVTSRSLHPIFQVPDTKKNMCCRVWTPENGCLRAAPPKKWPFLAQNWPKNANFEPKTVFFGLG